MRDPGRPGILPADLAAAVARAGVDPTFEPDGPSGARAPQDTLRGPVVDRGGYLAATWTTPATCVSPGSLLPDRQIRDDRPLDRVT